MQISRRLLENPDIINRYKLKILTMSHDKISDCLSYPLKSDLSGGKVTGQVIMEVGTFFSDV